MMRLAIVFALLSAAAASPTPTSHTLRGTPNLAFQFYKHVVKNEHGNVIVSPLSVKTALSLLTVAANGKTFDDLSSALLLPSNKGEIADLYHELHESLEKNAGNSSYTLVNQIYVKQGYKLSKSFQDVAQEKFSSGVESVNFAESTATAQHINDFVAEKTHDKIKDLVKSDMINSDTRVFLVNAIHFKAAWEHTFDKLLTTEGNFHVSDTETEPVDFMNDETHFNYAALSHLKASALEMRYDDSKFSFVIVLPDEGSNLNELESNLHNLDLVQIPFRSRMVNVKIPKFKVEYEVNLNDVLKEFGLGSIFTSEADFSGLLEDTHEQLRVSDVIHKTFIEVNEAGTEAAGATGIAISLLSMPLEPPPKFHADRPFLYFIRDREENVILFSGRFVKPAK